MAQLVKGAREFLGRELACPVHDGAEGARTATR
jgi:hypothetical protein